MFQVQTLSFFFRQILDCFFELFCITFTHSEFILQLFNLCLQTIYLLSVINLLNTKLVIFRC